MIKNKLYSLNNLVGKFMIHHECTEKIPRYNDFLNKAKTEKLRAEKFLDDEKIIRGSLKRHLGK